MTERSSPDPEQQLDQQLDQRLERRVVPYWILADLVRAAVFTALALAAAEYWRHSGPLRDWLPAAARALGAVLAGLAVATPPLAFARWRFAVDDQLLAMRYGILFVEDRRVPVPRMQHVDLVRGPIERLFGLATLVVFTAGNEGSAFRVPGLGLRRAEALRDRILAARGRDVV